MILLREPAQEANLSDPGSESVTRDVLPTSSADRPMVKAEPNLYNGADQVLFQERGPESSVSMIEERDGVERVSSGSNLQRICVIVSHGMA